jgi:hypothetical protein
MDNLVRIGFILEHLIGAFACFFADVCGIVKNLLPSSVIRHFVNNENVLHRELNSILPGITIAYFPITS